MKRIPVKDITIDENHRISEITDMMEYAGGFQGKNLALGVKIWVEMLKDTSCTKFISFPACIVATGTRGIIRDIVRMKLVDAVITTCGTLDHDIARTYRNYYHGEFTMDDSYLYSRGIHRLGNILIPVSNYGKIIEKKMMRTLRRVYGEGKRKIAAHELAKEIGNDLNEDSILYWCSKNEIPVFIPGITDGSVGTQIWMFRQMHRDFHVDILEDESLISQIVFSSKKLGAIVIGGGISKHHTIWWSQFRDGLDYAVYITTAVEYDGSLSGAQTHEAVSWGKIKSKGKKVTICGDATALLPFMYKAVLEKMR